MELFLELIIILLQFLAEFFLQLIFELFGDVVVNAYLRRRKTPAPDWAVVAGAAILGALAGWLSLLVFPQPYLAHEALRIANLALTPIAIGGIMVQVGRRKARKGQEPSRLETFLGGALFAFVMAGVRFLFAK